MASSSYSRKWKYDVFVSYRGDDVSPNILSHARRRLNNENIVYFKDDEMERGEKIWPSLKDAIESSTNALVIISERFAESRWCLDELQHILECKEKYGQKVIPIFFHVDPSHVRKPTTGVFAAYFSRHKERFDNLVVEKWISAMTTIGNLSGFALENGSEADLLDKVVEVILQNTEPLPCIDTKELVGIESHVRKLSSLMRDTQCFMGITGMGGIGKTTIARVIFDLFRPNFEGSIFLSVPEVAGRSDGRDIVLTETFLSKLLKKEVKVDCPFVRHSDARSLLNKNLLVVLDDVNSEQFNNLLGELCSKDESGRYDRVFGSGTKVILISRDKKLLGDICGDRRIHEVKGLEYSDALKLFCRHAFRQDYPKEEFNDLVWPFLGYAGGNPLALKVLGSSLRGKTKKEWESLSENLGKDQDQDIYKILKISYDQLNECQKTIFLYIACFFDYECEYHEELETVIDTLDSCGWGATHGIGVLKDKCLLELDYGYLSMHKLLREMGKQIVKEESKDPGKRSILWEVSDVRRVFRGTSESEAVEAIRLCSSKQQIVLNPNDFAKVPYLKFLAIVYAKVQCPDGLDYLPDELRLLRWLFCPLERLPAQFQPTKLIELHLQESKLEELWEGSKDLRSLQSIDLTYSERLTKLPDLSSATNLMKMDLRHCSSLVEISSSIKNLHKLQSLNLEYCTNVRSLPCCIWKLKSLEELIIDHCPELENLSESMECPETSTSHQDIYGQSSPLKRLSIKRCSKIRFLPELPGKLLQQFSASECESLETSLFDLKQLLRSQDGIEYLDDYYVNNILNFTNCWKLDIRWAEIAALAKKRIEVKTMLFHFKTGNDYRGFDHYCPFFMSYSGCEIPKWITHQNMGDSITLQIPVNERLLGFAISAVLPLSQYFHFFQFPVSFNFKNSSGGSFVWNPLAVLYNMRFSALSDLNNTIICGIPLPVDCYSEMIDKLGSDGDYYEVTLDISRLILSIKRPEDRKCGIIPLYFQNANGKRLKTSLDETTEVIIKDNNGNFEVFIDDYRIKNPDRKTLSKMYKEVTTDNFEVNHQGILYCIWGNENCKKYNEVETFSWLNKRFSFGYDHFDNEDEDKDGKHTQKFEQGTQEISRGMEFGPLPNPSQTFIQQNLGDMEPTITEELKTWKLTEINEPSQCWSLKLPDGLEVPKVSRLVYTNSGSAILALASNTIHLFWKLRREYNTRLAWSLEAEGIKPPLEWKPLIGRWMINEIADTNPEEVIPCFALAEGDSKLVSASGGKISIFNIKTFEKEKTLMSPPPATTYLACHPQDSNIIAIGRDDSTILICNTLLDMVIRELKGHFKRVTGLAFSHVLNVLVSSGADAQLCVWTYYGWEKQKTCFLEVPATAALSNTQVQFHHDQIHFLVVHEAQLAIYETTMLQCVKYWVQCESSAPICHATFSCDSQLVYACFLDATICVFRTANLSICSRINPLSYLPANVSDVHPLVVAANSRERNQFALGLSDGGVYILQPLESVGVWDVPAHSENESASCEVLTLYEVLDKINNMKFL